MYLKHRIICHVIKQALGGDVKSNKIHEQREKRLLKIKYNNNGELKKVFIMQKWRHAVTTQSMVELHRVIAWDSLIDTFINSQKKDKK